MKPTDRGHTSAPMNIKRDPKQDYEGNELRVWLHNKNRVVHLENRRMFESAETGGLMVEID